MFSFEICTVPVQWNPSIQMRSISSSIFYIPGVNPKRVSVYVGFRAFTPPLDGAGENNKPLVRELTKKKRYIYKEKSKSGYVGGVLEGGLMECCYKLENLVNAGRS